MFCLIMDHSFKFTYYHHFGVNLFWYSLFVLQNAFSANFTISVQCIFPSDWSTHLNLGRMYYGSKNWTEYRIKWCFGFITGRLIEREMCNEFPIWSTSLWCGDLSPCIKDCFDFYLQGGFPLGCNWCTAAKERYRSGAESGSTST